MHIQDAAIPFEKFSNKDINFLLSQLFEMAGSFNKLKAELPNDMSFQLAQLKLAIPAKWKALISNYSDIDQENLCQNHHVIK